MTKPKAKGGVRVGQGSPDHALTLAYLPLGLLITILLAGLFSVAFGLGFAPAVFAVALWLGLIGAVSVLTRQTRLSAAAGTRLTLAHMGLVCLVGGVAAAAPVEFPPLMRWSLVAIAAAAAAIIAVEQWLTEKIGAAGPFSRTLAREATAVLALSLAILLWRSNTVGVWVVAAGAVHYAVLLASLASPALRTDAAGAWQPYARFAVVAVLAVALTPVVPALAANLLGAGAVIFALAGSAAGINTARS